MRMKHQSTGVVAEVSEETAKNLDVQWKAAPTRTPSKKAAAPKPADDDTK